MAKPTVLVVDDDREVTQYVGDVLVADGWKVLVEKDGDWALRTFKSRRLDAAVLDVLTPVLNGFQVAEAIRKDPRGKDLPIVILSGVHRGKENRQEAIERLGLLGFLEKPIDGDELRRLLREELDRRESSIDRARTGPRPAIPRPGEGRAAPGATPASGSAAMAPGADGRDGGWGAGKQGAPESAPRPPAQPASQPVSQALRREPVSLRGSLAKVSFGRLLHELYRIQATGALFMLRDTVKKIVYLDAGHPVAVKSNLLRECLGQVLVAKGRLSQEQVEALLERSKTERKLLGQALVEGGLLLPDELLKILDEQLALKLDDLLAWSEGEYQFKENARIPSSSIRTARSSATFIVQGVLGAYDEARLQAEAAPLLGAYPGPAEEPLFRYQALELEPGLEPILGSLDGSQTWLHLVEDGPFSRVVSLGLVLGLHQAGVLDFYERETRFPPLMTARRREASSQTLIRPDDPRLEELLASEAMKLKKRDHFAALGLGRTATPWEVEAAYDGLAWSVHPDRFWAHRAETRELAEGLFGRLRAAYMVLRSPFRRAAYLEQLADARFVVSDDPSEEVERHLGEGSEHLQDGRYEQATWHFRRAVGLDPRSAVAHASLGFCMYKAAPTDQGTAREAVRFIERALALDPKLDLAHYFLGLVHLGAEELDLAREHFSQALRLNPGNRAAAEQLEIIAS
ncbi:MAG: response regulator [Polyangia bacterium]|jgi:CheY-like chemotaxis protein/DnaJ-domain-containing protein 1|nr:response regulator [Polyangia bacterium]